MRTHLPKILLIIFMLSTASLSAQKVGLLMDSYVLDRWYSDQKHFTEKVKSLGGEVVVEVAYGDTTVQEALAKKMIAAGIKVLVVVPIDGKHAAKIVTHAKSALVPVISYDRLILSNDLALYASYDNVKVGILQAEYALKKVSTGNYLLFNGPVSDNNAVLFRQGQLKALESAVKSGKINVIGDYVMNGWGELDALMEMQNFLSANKPTPNAILAANDALANGVIQALPAELTGKVVITGQDADLVALRNIVVGTQSMTIYKPIKPLAEMAAEMAMKLTKGDNLPGTVLKSGEISVKAILLAPIVVDKDNYKSTVVKDGHAALNEIEKK